ncbi:hypothetical protein [Nostoc sp.]|uniref:hypothetical protein n=1 Tax=Nostoc sp. TaxID=1180 RepID=UPI002FF863C7
MGRRIVATQAQSINSDQKIDTYFDRVVKYIPTDVVALWVTVTGLIKGSKDVPTDTLLWITFAFGIFLTVAWTLKTTGEPKKPPAITQTAISTGAFIVWVFALGEPFATTFQGFYKPLYGSLLMIAYTSIVPLIIPPESK